MVRINARKRPANDDWAEVEAEGHEVEHQKSMEAPVSKLRKVDNAATGETEIQGSIHAKNQFKGPFKRINGNQDPKGRGFEEEEKSFGKEFSEAMDEKLAAEVPNMQEKLEFAEGRTENGQSEKSFIPEEQQKSMEFPVAKLRMADNGATGEAEIQGSTHSKNSFKGPFKRINGNQDPKGRGFEEEEKSFGKEFLEPAIDNSAAEVSLVQEKLVEVDVLHMEAAENGFKKGQSDKVPRESSEEGFDPEEEQKSVKMLVSNLQKIDNGVGGEIATSNSDHSKDQTIEDKESNEEVLSLASFSSMG